jgi:HK97 family phage prohead protease
MVQTEAASIVRKISKAEATTIDAAEGIVEAFVNTMGVLDYDDEIIKIDAFSDSIMKGGQTVAWFHDQSTPVGKVLDAAPVPYGEDEQTGMATGRLKAVMQFNMNTQRGREAFADVQFGSVKEWSVGFRSLSDGIEMLADGTKARVIDALDWVEVSPVLRGASPNTQTITSKSASDALGTEQVVDDASDTEAELVRESIEITKIQLTLETNKDG